MGLNGRGRDWNGWWGGWGRGGYWWPWFGYGWGWPGYYGGYYSYYPGSYGYGYGDYADYGYDSAIPYTAAYAPSDTVAADSDNSQNADNGEGMDYYQHALEAFREGDFRNATRLAGHASIDEPRNPNVHILLMLGLFAMGEYRGAAMEAHGLAATGKIPDWDAVYQFYGNVTPYTEQLRKLETFVHDHQSAPEGRFLLGFQYLIAGHKDAAKNQFTKVLQAAPKDRLAAQLLTRAGGTVPANIERQLPPAPGSSEAQRGQNPATAPIVK